MTWSVATKIRTLLWSSLAATLLVALVMVVVQWLGDRYGRALELRLSEKSALQIRIASALDKQQGVLQRILRESDPDTLLALLSRDSLLEAGVRDDARILGSADFDSVFARLQSLDSTVVQLILEGRRGEAQDLYLERSSALVQGILDAQEHARESWMREMEALRGDWARRKMLLAVFLLLLVCVGGGVAALMGRRLVEGIVEPLRVAHLTMEDIAAGEGDLTRRLDVRSHDEIGQLASAFNRFVERVHRTVRTVEDGVGTLNGASGRIGTSTRTLVEESEAVARRSREVAATSRETGALVGSASRATDDLAMGLARIAAAIEELSASVREVSRSCQEEALAAGRADRDVASARENFQGLVVAVQDTTRLLEGIQNISDQTQMLALNATIEAARAGEAGRGFAVVAASVKDLSRQALGTTREISERIEAMGRAMAGADASISSLEDVVRSVRAESSSIAAAVEEQEATIAELSRSIGETHQQSQSISADVRGASRGTDLAAQEIEGVSAGVAQAAREIVAVREGMQELEALAADLKALVGRFRT